ncbi:MAG: S8/S53 family peptidase [Oscillospiraceae bacterium]|nr:S8/S53 family peptidase [Oscillospiraceae bacterium]
MKPQKSPQKIIKFILPILSILLILSLIINIIFFTKLTGTVTFSNANSTRDTYFTVHNVKAAHEFGTGQGVKVGVMDWGFGVGTHPELYADAINFSREKSALDREHHGLWMSNALREIAPDCEIYALSTTDNDETKMVDNMVKAIDWAIDNNIDILTYSNAAFSEKNRPKVDEAVSKAAQHGIITTFIHYDNPSNFLPNGFFEFNHYNREPDINILHYDYNVLFPFSGIPHLSVSSTSPVLAGFVAILKSVNPDLSPSEYKSILIETSYSAEFYDEGFNATSVIPRIANIEKAAALAEEMKKGE